MRKHLILSAVAAMTVAGSAMADGLSYTYAQGDFQAGKLKGSGDSVNGTGFGADGSIGFMSNFFGTVGIDTNKYSENGESLRFTNLSVGLGGHWPLTPMIDLVGEASFERAHLKEENILSDSYNGWGLSAGVRGMATDKIQWNGSVNYRDAGDIGSGIGLDLGGRYYFMPAFSVGVDLTYQKYDDTSLKQSGIVASARYEFPGL
ncbi:MAG: outer membrane beta-barrel protein [Pseudomonadota bacterium]